MTESPYLPTSPSESSHAEFPPASPPEHPATPSQVTVEFPRLRPYVTYTILGFTILVYVLQLISQYALGYDLPGIMGMKINEYIATGQYWRLLTPVLLHGSLLHIGFNMYALYAIGPSIEQYFGHGRFLILYLLSGFAGNVISLLFSAAPSLGSSTAIFGLFGAQGIFIYLNRQLYGQRARSILTRIIYLAVINLIIGLSPGIDNWGHLGGLIGGVAFTWFGGPKLKLTGLYPHLALDDERRTSEVLNATFLVGTLFALLAAGKLLLGP
ncbi:MAG: rhomboid family intramembrane serine protease [Chloroflexota bacterium]